MKKPTYHGLSNTPLYFVWRSMRERCFRPKNLAYKYYGGRGIKVCAAWIEDFLCFHQWAILAGYQEGLSIDRINNDGNYEPANCQFITKGENVIKDREMSNYDELCDMMYSLIIRNSINQSATMVAQKKGISKRTVWRAWKLRDGVT